MCPQPKHVSWSPNTQCASTWRQDIMGVITVTWGCQREALMQEASVRVRWEPGDLAVLSAAWAQGQGSHPQARKRPSQCTRSAGPLILDFQPLELWQNRFLGFKCPSLCCLLWQYKLRVLIGSVQRDALNFQHRSKNCTGRPGTIAIPAWGLSLSAGQLCSHCWQRDLACSPQRLRRGRATLKL